MKIQRLIAAALAGLAATTFALTTATAQASTLHRCYSQHLTVSLHPAGAAAGTAYYWLRFTSHAAGDCTLTGYPGVSYVTSSGHQAGPAAARNPRYPVRTIVLRPGVTVRALLGVGDWRNYPVGECHPERVAALRVYAPDAYRSLILPSPGWTCSARRVLSVTAVTQEA
jgi:hypothetical protein